MNELNNITFLCRCSFNSSNVYCSVRWLAINDVVLVSMTTNADNTWLVSPYQALDDIQAVDTDSNEFIYKLISDECKW